MYIKLVDSHINRLNAIKANEGHVIVYKGFPIDFMRELAKTFPLLNDEGDLITDNKLDLEKIVANKKTCLRNLLGTSSQTKIMYYEEFLLIMNHVELYEGKIILFENNLFDSYYPNQSSTIIKDIDREIEKSNFNVESNSFYSDAYFINEVNYVQYINIDIKEYPNLTQQYFFNNELLASVDINLIKTSKISDLEDLILLPSVENNQYQQFKAQLYFNEVKKSAINIALDKSVVNSQQYIIQMKILSLVLKSNNVAFCLYEIEKEPCSSSRNDYLNILNTYWNSKCFRDLSFYRDPDLSNELYLMSQGKIIEDIVNQAEAAYHASELYRDVFITAPTGAGKSLLFQIPAIYLAQQYKLITIVISPLKALMNDQIRALEKRGINIAACIHSDISLVQREEIMMKIKSGDISIIYVSPELLLSYDIKMFIGDQRKIGLFIIDEAHLITTWGRDFRVDYWYLGSYIRKLRKQDYFQYSFPVVALTATAVYSGKDDIVHDTEQSLFMKNANFYIGNVRRDEINFNISKFEYTGNHEAKKMERTIEAIVNNVKNKIKTIVYFPYRSQVDEAFDSLSSDIKECTGRYFSDVDKNEKYQVLEDFHSGKISVVLATKAFGMGVDISDIQVVFHHAPSGSLADYVQEIGRVARDKDKIKGLAQVFFHEKDMKFTNTLYGLSAIRHYQVKYVLQKIVDLYDAYKKQNMLVSAEDFDFIFGDTKESQDSREQKIKSAMMLLEKDLLEKFRYNILLVRPKSLYATVYGCVNNDHKAAFLSKYGNYSELVSTIDANRREDIGGLISVDDVGDIYRIHLDKIWNEYFKDYTFPQLKYKYFKKDLFEDIDVTPRAHILIKIKSNAKESLVKLQEYFTNFNSIFSIFEASGNYFTKNELEEKLKIKFKNQYLVNSLRDLLLQYYSSESGFGTYIQEKRNPLKPFDTKYRVIKNPREVQTLVLRLFKELFSANEEFSKYICFDNQQGKLIIKLAFLLEALYLGTYDISGGQKPQLFIRLNDPYRLKQVLNKGDYENKLLNNINDRHERSVAQMKAFFSGDYNKQQRWDFIEDYFLGKLKV